MGAQRFQVFVQFVSEAVIFSLFALVLSYGMLQLLKPAFAQLNISREFEINLEEDYLLYTYFLAFALAVGVIAGLLPAGYLSAFKPIKILKDGRPDKIYSRPGLRKALIVGQFSISLIFIIVVLIINSQIRFMLNKDYGINDKNIINVRLQGNDYEKFSNEISRLSGVERIGGVSHALGTWADHSSEFKKSQEDDPFIMRDFLVDPEYIENIELDFVSGQNFDHEQQPGKEHEVILNEKALPLFKLRDAVSALGQTIYVNDSVLLTVKGVVKDFHFRPLNYEIGPLALRYKPEEINILSVKTNPKQTDEVKSSIESIWKALDPGHTIDIIMMDQEIDEAYENAGFKDMIKIVGYISFLAVTIACLGMLGMARYSTETRLKEIGIRKVMGSSTKELILLLSRSYFIMIALAVAIAVPIAYLTGKFFLDNYAYKVSISVFIILGSVLFIALLGLITIGSQTWRAASISPVVTLKHE